MKIVTIFFVLLFFFGLCSCSNTLQEKISTKKPSEIETMSKEISTEEPPGTETVSEKITAEAPTGAVRVSVVFMGETIMAHGYYPGVPDEYIPVLNDLYLYGELSRRYNNLNYEDKITQEIMRESENVQREIRSRGFLPYPGDGLGITGGYALVDLDGDGGSELIIFDNSPYARQMPVIESVFAIRSGRLVCIDDGTSDLNYAILTADDTFYKCIDWRGAGYADLSAFRLEAGMSKFTITSEAHAALSFSDGDVPVPYWVKKENGNEINITEDEFNTLLEQYKNPKELMVLDFVPLNPDGIDLWSIPRPTEEPPATLIDYPAVYQCAPEGYKPILDALFRLQECIHRDEYVYGDGMEVVGFSDYPYDSKLGYALVDLNNDGVLELLLGSMDGLNDSSPNSIFTLKDGQPVLITSFWSRNRGVISGDGTIYSAGSGGAAYTYLYSYRFEKYADTLTQLTDMRSDYSFSEEKPYYFQVMEGRNHYISEKEFLDFCEMYDTPHDRMRLTFIPIAS